MGPVRLGRVAWLDYQDDENIRRAAIVAWARKLDEIDQGPDWQYKFDALIAAVFSEDDATRDRILAAARRQEAVEEDDDAGTTTP